LAAGGSRPWATRTLRRGTRSCSGVAASGRTLLRHNSGDRTPARPRHRHPATAAPHIQEFSETMRHCVKNTAVAKLIVPTPHQAAPRFGPAPTSIRWPDSGGAVGAAPGEEFYGSVGTLDRCRRAVPGGRSRLPGRRHRRVPLAGHANAAPYHVSCRTPTPTPGSGLRWPTRMCGRSLAGWPHPKRLSGRRVSLVYLVV